MRGSQRRLDRAMAENRATFKEVVRHAQRLATRLERAFRETDKAVVELIEDDER